MTSIAASTITGGKDVTISHATFGDVTAIATAGALDITTDKGDVFVGSAAGQDADATTDAMGTVTIDMTSDVTADTGTIDIDGGTTIDIVVSSAISAADRAEHIATTASTLTAKNTATAADVAADTKVTDLTALATALAATDGTADTISEVMAITANYLDFATIGTVKQTITQAEKVSIDEAFDTAYTTTVGTTAEKVEAAQAAVATITTALVTTATAAAAETQATLDAATATNDAAELVIATGGATGTDTVIADAVDDVVITATENTALTSFSATGNYGSAANAVTDASANNDTLKTVSLDNAGDFTFTGLGIETVNLSNYADNTTVVNATAANTLAINLDTVSGSVIDVSTGGGKTTTVDLDVTGTNTITLTAANTTALNITGAGDLTSATAIAQAAAVIDASTATGNITTTTLVGQEYKGGAGVDTITSGAGLQTAKVDGGAGDSDTMVVVNAANFATTGAALYHNFETLSVADGVAVADMTKFTNSTLTSVVLGASSDITTGLNATQASDITITATGTNVIGVTGATTNGQLDTVNIDVNDGASAVNVIALTTPDIAGVETINLTATDSITVTGLMTDTTALTEMNIDGAGVVSITSAAAPLNVNSTINASGVTAQDAGTISVTLNFLAATGNGISLIGSAGDDELTGTNVVGKGNSIDGGEGNNAITGGQADDVITAGDGNNTIVTGAGANTVTVGDGHNNITGGVGVDTVTAGNGYNAIATDAGDDIITVGNGGTEEFAGTFAKITAGDGNDTITLGSHAAGTFAFIVTDAKDDNGIDTIVGFTSDDIISGFGTDSAKFVDATATDTSGYATLALAADAIAVAEGAAAAVDAIAFSFDSDGDTVNETYVMMTSDNAYTAAADTIVEITGTDASTLTIDNFIA